MRARHTAAAGGESGVPHSGHRMLRTTGSRGSGGAAGRDVGGGEFSQASGGGDRDCGAFIWVRLYRVYPSERIAGVGQEFPPRADFLHNRNEVDRVQHAEVVVGDIFAHTELMAAPVFEAANERTRPNLKVQDGWTIGARSA